MPSVYVVGTDEFRWSHAFCLVFLSRDFHNSQEVHLICTADLN